MEGICPVTVFNWLVSFVSTLFCLDLCIQIIVVYITVFRFDAVSSRPLCPDNCSLHYWCFFVTLVCYDRCGHRFCSVRILLFFALFFGSCYWSLPMNSRSDREEVLTAVTSAPKLPYNKDDRDKRMRLYLPGL
jgi:hypothetical protein